MHSERILVRGLTFMRTGYPDRAAVVFAEGLKANPTNAVLLASMSSAQQALGDFSSAFFYMQGALHARPENLLLHRQALALALDSGDAEEALLESNEILRLSPSSAVDYVFHLTMLSRLDQNSESVPVAERAVILFPGDEELLRVSIEAFQNSGNSALSEWASRKLLAHTQDPDDGFALARILIRASKWSAAADELLLVLREDSSHDEALAAISVVQSFLPNRDIRSELPRGVIPLPSSPLSGEELQHENNSQDGERDPSQGANGDLLSRPDSLAMFRSRFEASPLDESAAADLASFLFRNQEFAETATFASEQIARDPRQLTLWLLEIRSRVELNELSSALDVVNNARTLFPGYLPFEVEFVIVLSKNGQVDEAGRRARVLLQKLDPDSPYRVWLEDVLTGIEKKQ